MSVRVVRVADEGFWGLAAHPEQFSSCRSYSRCDPGGASSGTASRRGFLGLRADEALTDGLPHFRERVDDC